MIELEIGPNGEGLQEVIKELMQGPCKVKVTQPSKRTLTQNAAIHLYAKQLCEALNDAGLDMVKTLELLQSNDLDIEWTPEQVKDRLWRKVQLAMTNKESTADLTKTEVSEVYEHLNRFLGKAGLPTIPFPDRFGR